MPHQFAEGSDYCTKCGTSKAFLEKDPTTPCVYMHGGVPESRPFHSAMDDIDAIHSRIQELRSESDQSLIGK
jgi:hypothetical protein